jgi:hypothetical protein
VLQIIEGSVKIQFNLKRGDRVRKGDLNLEGKQSEKKKPVEMTMAL